jgi:hypothetical protein
MTLKRELEAPTSPLRLALEEMLPDLGPSMRADWKRKMSGAVASFDPVLPADVLGHAISERIAWQFAGSGGHLLGQQVLVMAGARLDVIDDLVAETTEPCRGVDPDRAARIACLVGLADRAFRAGRTDEPWYEPLLGASTLDDALAAVDAAWLSDVRATSDAALKALAPLAGNTPATRGPVFAGSHAVGGADGDLILGRSLVEVKAVRTAELRKRDLQQVVTYALLDWDDRYALEEVALLAARHGVLVRWALDELVTAASRGAFTVASARSHLTGALT